MEILIGCDPEVFVSQKGKFKSAHGLIKGDKKNPHPVRNGAVQVDGMALEFNITPAATEDEFVIKVTDVLEQMKAMVPKYDVVVTPVAHFDAAYMKKQPAAALELGCDPDYDAWTGRPNVKPNADRPMRTASGHIHIGWTQDQKVDDPSHVADAYLVAKQMDFYLGLGSLFYDDDQERREMYGRAGCCRVKPYGVEYRTLSNAWLLTEERMRWVYTHAKLGVQRLLDGQDLPKIIGNVSTYINNGDRYWAARVLQRIGINAPV